MPSEPHSIEASTISTMASTALHTRNLVHARACTSVNPSNLHRMHKSTTYLGYIAHSFDRRAFVVALSFSRPRSAHLVEEMSTHCASTIRCFLSSVNTVFFIAERAFDSEPTNRGTCFSLLNGCRFFSSSSVFPGNNSRHSGAHLGLRV